MKLNVVGSLFGKRSLLAALAMVGVGALQSENRRWEFTLFGDNLTDEKYIRSGTAAKPTFGLVFANFARSRTWGLRVQYRFGDRNGYVQ